MDRRISLKKLFLLLLLIASLSLIKKYYTIEKTQRPLFPAVPVDHNSKEELQKEPAKIIAEDEKTILKYQMCKYPFIDAFDPVSMSYMSKHKKVFTCDEQKFSWIDDEVLRIKFLGMKRIWMYFIYRVNDWKSKLSKGIPVYENGRFLYKDLLKIEDEFVYLNVQNEYLKVVFTKKENKSWEEYHHVFLKPPNSEKTINDRPNIIMIHLDSVSDANAKRQLEKTYAYLKNHKHTVIFNQHSILADGTTANMTPLLTGHLLEDLPEARKSVPNGKTLDSWPFVYKDLHRLGYETWFLEEGGKVGTFNYRLRGFDKPPVKHFYRPLWMILDEKMQKTPLCGSKFYFEHIKQFHKTLKNHNKFSLFMFSYLVHDSPAWLFNLDEDIYNFYKYMDTKTIMNINNTVIILYGDHGNRASTFRSTFQGKLEERFPFLAITVPPWFERHKNEMQNLRRNKDVLTTHFDLYSTLQHIMTFPKATFKTSTKHGISLFRADLRKMNRTCADVPIKPHYCLCMNMFKEMDVNDTVTKQVTEKIILFMNEENEAYAKGMCAKLTLKSILQAARMQGVRNVFNFQVKFFVHPSNGLFEVTVSCDVVEDVVSPCAAPEISRINRYRTQPDCIKNSAPRLAKLCYCKSYKGGPSIG